MRKPNRVCLLDELRGLAVLLMIFYHGAYDAVYIFRFTGSGWFTSVPMDFLQLYIAVSFILIAGIMGRYSRSNFRRGVKTFLCGLLVTAVTLLVMPSERILFGILHFLGAAMMLLGLFEPLLRKIPDTTIHLSLPPDTLLWSHFSAAQYEPLHRKEVPCGS